MFSQPLSLVQLIDARVQLSWRESLALVQSLAETARGGTPTNAGGVLDEFGIDQHGQIVALNGECCQVSLSEIALFLGQLLPCDGVPRESRAPGGVHYAVARALGLVEAPPLVSVEQFTRSLKRFEQGDRRDLLRAVFERLSADRVRQIGARNDTTIGDRGPAGIGPAQDDVGLAQGDARATRAAAGEGARVVERRSSPPPDALRRLLREADRARFESLTASFPGDRREHTPTVDALRRLLREADQREYQLIQARRAPRRGRVAYAALVLAAGVAAAAGVVEQRPSWTNPLRGSWIGRRESRTTNSAPRRLNPRERHENQAPPPPPEAAGGGQSGSEGAGASERAETTEPRQRTGPRLPKTTAFPGGDVSALPPVPVLDEADRGAPVDGRLVQALDVAQHPIFSPSFAADGSAIFFDERDPVGSSLMQARADGHGDLRVVSVVSDGAQNYHPHLSPDGRTIAFDSDRDGVRGVYLASRDGRNVKRVSGSGYAAVPSWSPDGRHLVFIKAEEGHPKVWNLWRLDLASGDISRLTSYRYGQPWGASYFPDGRHICYAHEDELIVLDPDTGDSRAYRSPQAGRLVRTPAVSPDGRHVIFQVYRDGAWLLDLRDGDMRKVLADPSAEEFAWAPNGRQVAFHSRRGGDWGVWFMMPTQ